MRPSFTLGRIGGVEIGIHYTWIFAFILITWTLAAAFFPLLYPGWGVVVYWITGAIAALLLFASVLVHELAHSFVARSRGLQVSGITLFIFGGVSNLGSEAESAWDEFAITIVGPLTSVVLAGVFWGINILVPNTGGPIPATLAYLALINLLLGLFNLLPGFPLDGGRVLRSILWGSTGSLVKATNIAAGVGQIFGWLLIGFGVFNLLQGNLIGGIWIAFIGWFLNSAADASRRDVSIREAFRDVQVGDVMEREPDFIGSDTVVDDLVRERFLRRGIRATPVCDGGQLAGIVTLSDVKDVPEERWPNTTVGEIMTREPLYKMSPTENLNEAMNLMNEHNIHQVLVTEDGRLVGMLNRAHIIRYVQGAQELGVSARAATERRIREERRPAFRG